MAFPFSRSRHPSEAPTSSGGKTLALAFELIEVLAVSLAIIIPIRYFLVQPFYVKGASMEPNFFDHEYLVIDEISYRLREPKRGDIVVFRYPRDPKQFFIKRVIGLPSETVEIATGKVKVYNNAFPNGMLLDERSYLDQEVTGSTQTITLKPGEYYLMGDNRASSLDSRIFGPVSRSSIVGRVWLRGYPVDRWKLFEAPTY
ncbi:MAG: signal peptidase I [Candidatus Uhrbacteria bacterium]|nr:signal peptidase I [Candidatus Uhrbacteria bacterium]